MFLEVLREDTMRSEQSQTQELSLEDNVSGYHHITALEPKE